MAKKNNTTTESNLPTTLTDPYFSELRALLTESAKETDKMWTKTDLAHFFDGMNELKRGKYGSFCLEWYALLKKTCPNEYQDKLSAFFPKKSSVQHAFLAAKTAILACCSRKDIEKVLRENGASFLDVEFEIIMRSRRPDWLSDFLIWMGGDAGLSDVGADDYWKIYRRFVREKIILPEKNELWIRIMFTTMLFDTYNDISSVPTSIFDQLHADPELLKTDIWYFFEFVRFPHGWNLTSCDGHFSWYEERRKGEDWKGTICTLVKNGEMSKVRIIDGCFQSLSRPFSDHESKWYVQLLEQLIERLPISDEELVEDSERYLGLLDHPNPAPRGLGMQILERLFKSGKIHDKEAIERVAAILREPVKAKAKKGITLLEKIARRNPDLRNSVFGVLLEGLQHESPEIQQASLNLLLKYDGFADPKIDDAVQKIASSLSTSVQRSIPGRKEPIMKPVPVMQATSPKSFEVHYEPIEPIKTFEEFLDLAARLVEGFKEIDDVERFLDGLARLGNDRPDDFAAKTAPLLARAQKKIETFQATHPETGDKLELLSGFRPFKGHDILVDLRFAVVSWICGEMPQIDLLPEPIDMKWKHQSPADRIYTKIIRHGKRTWYDRESTRPPNPALLILSKRIETIAKNVCYGKTIPLLSTPTHHDGWIDPAVFVQRLIDANSKKIKHDEADKVLSLLRLMPENREITLKMFDQSNPSKDEWTDAVRYALGTEKIKIGKSAHYWIAAARCRNPLDDILAIEKSFPDYGPDAGNAATYRFEMRKIKYYDETLFAVPEPEPQEARFDWTLFPLAALHASTQQDWQERDGIFPWFLSIWPQNLDPVIALSIRSHSQNIDKNYDYGFRYVVKAMASPSVSLRPIGISALFLGLGMKCPLVHTTATDTAIVSINDGRLTPELAVQPICDLLALEILTLSRWIKPLKTIAEQSDNHAVFVHQLLENIVEHISAKEVGGFLELLYELGVSLNKKIGSEPCRHFLETFSGSGKAAKLAKKLLGL